MDPQRLTDSDGQLGVLETSPESIPQIQELVCQQEAIVPVRLVCHDPQAPPEQEPFQGVAGLPRQLGGVVGQVLAPVRIPTASEAD